MLLLLGGGLAGCASMPAAVNPVSWWHSLEGGPIAAQREPPPGAGAPYPNLANVPATPTFLPAPERQRISAALLADRTRSQQQALLEPLANSAATDTSAPLLTTAPAEPAAGAPAAAPGAAGASLPAVTSQPAPAPAAAAGPTEPASIAAATATLPAVPVAPPPPPALAGIGLPGPPPQPLLAATAKNGVRISFAAGSSALSAADRTRLAGLAARRGGAGVAVMGFGDARQSDPVAQSAALELGLARAVAVAQALAAAGVPESALRLGAEASGDGAVVALVR